MNWNNNVLENWDYENISNLEEKMTLAKIIAEKVKEGQVIGFGSGSTSFLAAKEIAKKIKKDGINIKAIPTSLEIKMLCSYLGIPTTSLLENKPDWSFDGADEVDSNNWLLKGRGGAMFKEKMNMVNSKITYILVDESKLVNKLGTNFKIPIECTKENINYIKEQIIKLGGTDIIIRKAVGKDGPIITENDNIILDAKFNDIDENLEKNIKKIVGVIESGLFIGYNVEIISTKKNN